jgi:hypothetical protein
MIDEKISSISRDLVFLANDGVTRILEETFCVDWRGGYKNGEAFLFLLLAIVS